MTFAYMQTVTNKVGMDFQPASHAASGQDIQVLQSWEFDPEHPSPAC